MTQWWYTFKQNDKRYANSDDANRKILQKRQLTQAL